MQPIEKTLWTIFAVIGFATIAGLVVLFAYFAFDALRDVVRVRHWKHKYKHRFDKSPTAACYCKDCIYHGTTYKDGGNNKCDFPGIEIWTPDEGFCFNAEPINAKEGERRERQ